jgi:TPR repeat protein
LLLYDRFSPEIPGDDQRAAALFRKACDAKLQVACFNLAYMHLEGADGTAQDPAKAVALFRKSCGDEVPAACRHLGIAFQEGKGVATDVEQAASYFRKACDLGDIQGCWLLGQDG